MRRRGNIALVLVILSILASQFADTQEPTEADWDWVNQHFRRTLCDLLPIPPDIYLRIGLRSYRDLYTDVLEYSFLIRQEPTQKPEAIVRMADGISIYDQIMAAHRKHPSASIEEIRKGLKVKELRLTTASCPAVGSSLEQFAKVRFRPPRDDVIILHPMVYALKTKAMTGEMNLTLTDDAHPLVRWANETRAALQQCTNNIAGKQPVTR